MANPFLRPAFPTLAWPARRGTTARERPTVAAAAVPRAKSRQEAMLAAMVESTSSIASWMLTASTQVVAGANGAGARLPALLRKLLRF